MRVALSQLTPAASRNRNQRSRSIPYERTVDSARPAARRSRPQPPPPRRPVRSADTAHTDCPSPPADPTEAPSGLPDLSPGRHLRSWPVTVSRKATISPLNCGNSLCYSVNRQPGDHHPAAIRRGKHRRRLALPRPPAQPATADDHEVLTDFA